MGVDFLNLEYVLLRVFNFFGEADQTLGVSAIPEGVGALVQGVVILGMVLTLILLVLLVYAQIRLVQVEHAGFHELEEEKEAHAHEAEVTPPQNERWERIVVLSTSANESDWRRAILEADIMLGEVLHEAGYPGVTVGEQLRVANPLQMTTLDLAWRAHKVRNDIAHEGDQLPLSERDVRATIDFYKRVFEEFGAV